MIVDSYLQQLFDYIINRQMMNEILRSQDKHVLNSACSSEDFNRSTVKRLFSSVFSIIDNDQEVSRFDEVEQKSRIEKLLENPCFVGHLQNKLRNEGLFDGLALQVHQNGYATAHNTAVDKAEMDYQDIVSSLTKFGQIGNVILTRSKKEAYVFFNSFLNAYICFKMLHNATLRGGSLRIKIDWVRNNEYHPQIFSELHAFVNNLNWESLFEDKFSRASQPASYYEELGGNSLKQNKLTCRYDIQIDNEREFQVARRIIGSKGFNMKKIIEDSLSCESKNYSHDNTNELLKLRLRGKGSGYKEGPEQQESNQNLHLCVSAKDEAIYSSACSKVERLLASIYSDYLQFTRRQGKTIDLAIKRVNIGQSSISNEESSCAVVYNTKSMSLQRKSSSDESSPQLQAVEEGEVFRISSQRISQLLQLRNKARRELNFSEADRIRNYLRSCGVCLIDEKGRRGKATEVTTWKYLY